MAFSPSDPLDIGSIEGDGKQTAFNKIKNEINYIFSVFSSLFSPSTGHKHTGAVNDAPKLTAANIVSVATGNVTSENVQDAINEFDTSLTAHKTDAEAHVDQFSALGGTLAEKALLAGSATQLFSVANATSIAHALALGQLTGVLSASGHVKIPIMEGATKKQIIIQWGAITVSSNTNLEVAFQTPFISACYGVFTSGINGSFGNSDSFRLASTPTLTNVTINNPFDGQLSGYYFAIGS